MSGDSLGGPVSYAVRAEGLTKRYGHTAALAGVDLAVRPGTVLGVLGPNGAGKTTAVRVLTTLTRPDGGSARVGGFDVVRQAHQVRSIIGVTGQDIAADDELTGIQNVVLVGLLLGLSYRAAKRRAVALLDRFGLAAAAGRKARTYSGGMRRRLDLCMSLVQRPRVLFLDEPTTGLDPQSRTQLWCAVRELAADGTAVLLTTQYLEEADRLADEIVVMDCGRVVATGTPDELKARTADHILQVRAWDPARTGEVARIVAESAGDAHSSPEGGNVVTAQVTDSATGVVVLRRLKEAGIAVAELSLRLPTLDEVFLSLVGRSPATVPPHRDPRSDRHSDPDSERTPA